MDCETPSRSLDIQSAAQLTTSSMCAADQITLLQTCIGKVMCRKTNNLEKIIQFTWTNANRMSVSVMTYGAIVMSMRVPNRQGISGDVVLGFDTLDEYRKYEEYHIGATLGRTANVIDKAEYQLTSDTFVALSVNHMGQHHKDGGSIGFSRVNWLPHVEGTDVILTYTSPANEEGYPGVVMAQIKYSLTNDNTFRVAYSATTDRTTPVDLATRIFFNLAGHAAGADALRRHVLHINAVKCIQLNENGVPQEKATLVGDMDWDCRIANTIGYAMTTQHCDYMNFTLSIDHAGKNDTGRGRTPTFVARVIDPKSGRVMEMYATHSCVQYSTCHEFPKSFCENMIEEKASDDEENETQSLDLLNDISCSAVMRELNDTIERTQKRCTNGTIDKAQAKSLLDKIYTNLKLIEAEQEAEEESNIEEAEEASGMSDETAIKGKEYSWYERNAGFCLQMQNFPDAVHRRKKCTDILLRPGQHYRHDIVYKFGLHIGGAIE